MDILFLLIPLSGALVYGNDRDARRTRRRRHR